MPNQGSVVVGKLYTLREKAGGKPGLRKLSGEKRYLKPSKGPIYRACVRLAIQTPEPSC